MIISRKPPIRDYDPSTLAYGDLDLLDVEFETGETHENAPSGYVRLNLNGSKSKQNGDDRLSVLISPYEVILAFASLPADSVGPAAKELFSHFHEHNRNETDVKQPMCAVTMREFNDRVVALLQACLKTSP